jgi:hypothetical protein
MVKNVFKICLVSLLLFSFSACEIPPTYTRSEIETTVKKICKEEFDLSIQTWLVGNTLWIYAPFTKLTDQSNLIDEKVRDSIRHVFLTLVRVSLSIDDAPEFFVVAISDIETLPRDLFYIGRVEDLIKLDRRYISLGEWQEREIVIDALNPAALGDKEGTHIQKYDFGRNEFISYLIIHNLKKIFTQPPLVEEFQIKEINANFKTDKITILFNMVDIAGRDYDLPRLFSEAEKVAGKYLTLYADITDIKEIEVIESITNITRVYPRKDLIK